MGQLIYLKDVVTLTLDEEKCIGCGMCLSVCPHAVWSLNDGKALIQSRDSCMECGACATNCPVEAINVRPGVGCAHALVSAALSRNKSSGCCAVESHGKPGGQIGCSKENNRKPCY
jgi:MinD superfamily P-loop ATPase containing an inserted ferredoxin domain